MCIAKLLDPKTNIVQITNNGYYTGTITNFYDRKYYKFISVTSETMTVTLENTGTIFNGEITFYKKIDEETLETVGKIYVYDPYIVSSIEIDPGEYLFCIISKVPVSYRIKLQFTYINAILLPKIECFTGDNCSMQFAYPTKECDAPIFYEIIEGFLPNNLVLRANGIIEGMIEEQDCTPILKQPPSFTWYNDIDENEEAWPTTLNYPFKVRAAMVNDHSIYADRSFKICVHNNWHIDKQEYLDSLPNFEHIVYTDDPDKVFETYEFEPDLAQYDFCKCEPKVKLELKEITEDKYNALCACPDTSLKLNVMTEEEFNNLCEPCVDNSNDYLPVFIECPEIKCEPEIVLNTDNPIDFCPCDTPEVIAEVIDNGMELIEDVPEFCLDEFINRMKNVKICKELITCDIKSPIIHFDKPKQAVLKASDLYCNQC
jgi:hypothetical protein